MRPRPLKQDSAVIRATGFADLSVSVGEVFRQARNAPTITDLTVNSANLANETYDRLSGEDRAKIIQQETQRIAKIKELQDNLYIETDDIVRDQIRTQIDSLEENQFQLIDEQTKKMVEDGRLLSVDALNEEFGQYLEFTEPMSREKAEILDKNKRAEVVRNAIIQKGLSGVSGYASLFGGSLVAAATDPIEVVAAFIPYYGVARRAKTIARFGKFKGRVTIGAGEGLAGSVVTEPFYYALSRQQQLDYTMGEALLNVGVGTFLGGGIGAAAGFFSKQKVSPSSVANEIDLPKDALPAEIKQQKELELDGPELATVSNKNKQNFNQVYQALGGEKVAAVALRQFVNDNAINVAPVMPRHVPMPQTLEQFVRSRGGINDTDPTFRGELSAVGYKGVKGYFNKKNTYVSQVSNPDGVNLEEMALAAQEAGYINRNLNRTEAKDQLVEKLRDEKNGVRYSFSEVDQQEVGLWEAALQGREAYDLDLENRIAIREQIEQVSGRKLSEEEVAAISDRMSKTGEDIEEAAYEISLRLYDAEAEILSRYGLDSRSDIVADVDAAERFDEALATVEDEHNFDIEMQRNEQIIEQYKNANQLTQKEINELEAELLQVEQTMDAYSELVRVGTICTARA